MTSLTITRRFAADRARIWRAWTDAVELAAWMWPPSFGTDCAVELREGGGFRLASDSASMAVSGEYLEILPLQRLVFTWRWDGEDDATLVTVTFHDPQDGDAGTEVRIHHERFADPSDCAAHEQGWNDCLDRLPVHLAA